MSTTDIFLRSRWERIQPTREFARKNRIQKIKMRRELTLTDMLNTFTDEEMSEYQAALWDVPFFIYDNDTTFNEAIRERERKREIIIRKIYRDHVMKNRGCQLADEIEECFGYE